MSAEILQQLWHSNLVVSLTLLLVLALRGLWLRCFGSGNALLLWLSVPLVLIALCLPTPQQSQPPLPGFASFPSASQWVPMASGLPKAVPDTNPSVDWGLLVLTLWLLGGLLLMVAMFLRQRRFLRALGRLEPVSGRCYLSESQTIGPVLLGAVRPRIVLPADFYQRYSQTQQQLILAHERCHLNRGDAQASLLATTILCLYWFNPLVYLAWSRFRMDQELACDAVVLRRHPKARREYAEAMLSTQRTEPGLPVGCTWQSSHPLKRRINMIYSRPKTRLWLFAGSLSTLSASAFLCAAAWASQHNGTVMTISAAIPADSSILVSAPPPSVRQSSESVNQVPSMPVTSTAPAAQTLMGRHSPADPQPQTQRSSDVPKASVRVVSSSSQMAVGSAGANSQVHRQGSGSSPSDRTAAQGPERTPAAVIASSRPNFPTTVWAPRLLSYPGMPERDMPVGEVEGSLWVMALEAELDDQGRITQIKRSDHQTINVGRGSLRRYERLATRAVREWDFQPAKVDGRPVASTVVLPFVFEADQAIPVGRAEGPTALHSRASQLSRVADRMANLPTNR